MSDHELDAEERDRILLVTEIEHLRACIALRSTILPNCPAPAAAVAELVEAAARIAAKLKPAPIHLRAALTDSDARALRHALRHWEGGP